MKVSRRVITAAVIAVPAVALLLGLSGGARLRGFAEPAGVLVEIIEPVTRDVYPDGRIWGDFKVRLTLRNTSGARVDKVKVLLDHLGNNTTYPKLMPQRTSLVVSAGPIEPGGVADVTVGPFKPFHPELDQEIVVNALNDRTQPGSVKKRTIKTAFHPQSQD